MCCRVPWSWTSSTRPCVFAFVAFFAIIKVTFEVRPESREKRKTRPCRGLQDRGTLELDLTHGKSLALLIVTTNTRLHPRLRSFHPATIMNRLPDQRPSKSPSPAPSGWVVASPIISEGPTARQFNSNARSSTNDAPQRAQFVRQTPTLGNRRRRSFHQAPRHP